MSVRHTFSPLNNLFAPTSWSPMSKLFRFFGILGEKKWNEVVSDLKSFAHKWCKIAAVKKLLQIFFISSLRLRVFLPPLLKVRCPHKECKIAPQKKVCFRRVFSLLAGFFWYQCYYPHRLRDSLSPVCAIFKILSLPSEFSKTPWWRPLPLRLANW